MNEMYEQVWQEWGAGQKGPGRRPIMTGVGSQELLGACESAIRQDRA